MRIATQRGDVLIALIIALVLASLLLSGITRLTTSSSFTEILDSNNDAAYELARTGIRYGILGYTGTFHIGTNSTFNISVNGNGNVITSTGQVSPGAWQSTRILTYAVPSSIWPGGSAPPPPSSSIPGPGPGNPWGNPTGTSTGTGTQPQAVTVNPANGTIGLGGGINDSYGAAWYQGTNSASGCSGGVCNFGSGLNIYFQFVNNSTPDNSSTSTSSADGFTFAVISALTNTLGTTGGQAPNGASMGELMGYAGPGNSTDGNGLKPPKMAIEFDTYPNTAGNMCSSANSGSRADPGATNPPSNNPPGTFSDHAALIFWGARTPASSSEPTNEVVPSNGYCGTGISDSSYDDNVHGAGGACTGTGANYECDPVNSSGGSSGFYAGPKLTCLGGALNCNWMKDGYTYDVRIEIVRPSADTCGNPGGSGSYCIYTVRAWILSENPSCNIPNTGSSSSPACFNTISAGTGLTAQQQLDFQDVLAMFPDTTLIPAQINTTANIYQADHQNFDNIFFGFTEATGQKNQQINVSAINTFFPQGTCSYSISSPSPTSPTSCSWNSSTATVSCPWAGGSGGTITITPSSTTCPWIASTNMPSMIQFTNNSNSSATNSTGTITYNVLSNACGSARTGHIHTTSQSITPQNYITVTQAASPGFSGFSSYQVNNASGSHFYVMGGTYASCTEIHGSSSPNTFTVNCSDTSAVNVYANTDSSCLLTPVNTVSYTSAVSADTNTNGQVKINSSYQLVDN